METKTYRAIRHDVVRAKQKQKRLNTQVSVIGSLVEFAYNVLQIGEAERSGVLLICCYALVLRGQD